LYALPCHAELSAARAPNLHVRLLLSSCRMWGSRTDSASSNTGSCCCQNGSSSSGNSGAKQLQGCQATAPATSAGPPPPQSIYIRPEHVRQAFGRAVGDAHSPPSPSSPAPDTLTMSALEAVAAEYRGLTGASVRSLLARPAYPVPALTRLFDPSFRSPAVGAAVTTYSPQIGVEPRAIACFQPAASFGHFKTDTASLGGMDAGYGEQAGSHAYTMGSAAGRGSPAVGSPSLGASQT
jgi:hypothetical protein